MPRVRRRRRLWLGTAAGLLAAAAVVALVFPRQLLCVDSGEVHADALVLLGGDFGERAAQAGVLFGQKAAPWIIVSGAGDSDLNFQLLTNHGVPAAAIQIEPRSHNTRENAEFSVALLRARGVNRAIIVTSWYHSRRALRCFRHYAPEIEFYSRPAYPNGAAGARSGASYFVYSEYVKLPGYWLRYGICPF